LADDPAVTVATVAPVAVMFPGLVQGVPDPELTADPGTAEALVGDPVDTDAYAVLLKMLLGEFQDGPVARLPIFGPEKMPERDTALPKIPVSVMSDPMTSAVNVVGVTLNTNTVCPFKKLRTSVKPLSINPSLIVGVTPV
jgi:hypothetical protein